MKKLLFPLFVLLLVMPFGITQAQPAQKLISVVISPDHSNWEYKVKQEAKFTVQVFKSQILLDNVSVDYELGPEVFPSVKKQNVVLKDGKTEFKASLKESGFLRCRVVAKVDGREYEGLATVAYEADKIRPTTPDPKDFDLFWINAFSDARMTP